MGGTKEWVLDQLEAADRLRELFFDEPEPELVALTPFLVAAGPITLRPQLSQAIQSRPQGAAVSNPVRWNSQSILNNGHLEAVAEFLLKRVVRKTTMRATQ